VSGLAQAMAWSARLREPMPTPPAPPAPLATRPRSEHESLQCLAACGVPVMPFILAHDEDEAAAAAAQLGGHVVVKIASPDIAHKTEAGGVRLNIVGKETAARAYEEIVQSAKAYAPKARIDGVIVSPMREAGVELIVGVARDPDWGPVLVVGLGGVFTEALKDSQLSLLPVTPTGARDMLESLRGAAVLTGSRGAPAADLDRLAAAITAIGDAALALGPDLAALEVNPLRVRGGEIECLDGLAIYST
jgi:acyl-CoA synthetase (NDP forming)